MISVRTRASRERHVIFFFLEGKTRMVNRDGSADFKRKERYKQKLESVELTPSDELFMKGDGGRFGDGMSLW